MSNPMWLRRSGLKSFHGSPGSHKESLVTWQSLCQGSEQWGPQTSCRPSHSVLQVSTLSSQGHSASGYPFAYYLFPCSLLRLTNCSFSNRSNLLLPQGLCTRLFLSLDECPVTHSHGSLLLFLQALHKCHLERPSLITPSK